MKINVENKENIVLIHLKGDFHIGNVNAFEEIWHKEIEEKPQTIAINCKELKYIDSSAIGTLVKFLNNAMSKQIKLVFYDLNPAIENIFKNARLDKFFNIVSKKELESKYF